VNDYFWAEKFIEIEADVEVECSRCDLERVIENAELTGNREELFLKWACVCGHSNYDQFHTADYIEERYLNA
jgi:hypothetical protein